MSYINGANLFECMYKKVLSDILAYGVTRETRGTKSLEIAPYHFQLSSPLNNLIMSKKRKLNKSFAAAEFMWILSGRNDVDMISFYNNNIKNFSDNNIIFSGAYGPRVQSQLNYVLSTLNKDIYSRQAVMSIWEPRPLPSKDIPCTLTLHFFVDSLNRLCLNANMRSNDAILGLPYDVYNFTMIQNFVAMMLNVEVGQYSHYASSLHIYDNHYALAEEISKEPVMKGELYFSKPFVSNELAATARLEKEMRSGNYDASFSIIDEAWIQVARLLQKRAKKMFTK